MDEIIKLTEEDTDIALTPVAPDRVAERPEAQVVAASSFAVGGGSSFAGAATSPALDEPAAPLFSPEEARDFRGRWDAIQGSFVDEPRRAVEQADSLVSVTITRMAEMFTAEREKLEGQWTRGENVSTEDLRLALRRYRSFFGRLLSV